MNILKCSESLLFPLEAGAVPNTVVLVPAHTRNRLWVTDSYSVSYIRHSLFSLSITEGDMIRSMGDQYTCELHIGEKVKGHTLCSSLLVLTPSQRAATRRRKGIQPKATSPTLCT